MTCGDHPLIWQVEWSQQVLKIKFKFLKATYELVKKSFKCQKRKNVDVKGIGISDTYLIMDEYFEFSTYILLYIIYVICNFNTTIVDAA